MSRAIGAVVVLCASLALAATMASAAVRPGGACTKEGKAGKAANGVEYVCTKSGKKLVWKLRPIGKASATGTQPKPQAGGTAPKAGTTGTAPKAPATGGAQPAPGGNGTSAVTVISSAYAELQPTTHTKARGGDRPDGFLSAMGLDSTTGTALYDHPSGLASNGKNLVLVDRGNNRILVWNTAPASSSAQPDFVLCQSSTTSNGSGSGLHQCNWPSDAVATADGKFLVADTDNHRILVWTTMPTTTGQAAAYALDLGTDAWPWGVWSNGTKLIASLTTKGQLKIWNSFPASGSAGSDLTVASPCLGTPRGIVSNGTATLVGDHNGKCGNSSVGHVFATWPTSSNATPEYGIVPVDPNYAWPHGSFDAASGKLYLLSRQLTEYPGLSAQQPAGRRIAAATPFEGGDGGDVEVAGGHVYVSEYNGNRVAVFKGIPGENATPSFYLGSPGLEAGGQSAVNTLKTNHLITNPQVATLGGAMAISSDFDRTISVWKKIPATNGAKPDLVWTTQHQNASNSLLAMDFQPNSSAAATVAGVPAYAAAGERTVVVWKGIPTKATDVPLLNVKDKLGNVTFDGELVVALDSRYFYLLDGRAKKIHVWSGLPASGSDNPDFSLSVEVNRIRADGTWLVGTSLYTSPKVRLWSVATLRQDAAVAGSVTNPQLNLPQDALVANGALFVADTSFHRVLVWNDVNAALAGGLPDAYLGATSSSDVSPAHSTTELRWPASLWAAEGYLWVGERKFGHRVLRYALSP